MAELNWQITALLRDWRNLLLKLIKRELGYGLMRTRLLPLVGVVVKRVMFIDWLVCDDHLHFFKALSGVIYSYTKNISVLNVHAEMFVHQTVETGGFAYSRPQPSSCMSDLELFNFPSPV